MKAGSAFSGTIARVSRRRVRGLLFAKERHLLGDRSFAKVPDWAVCIHAKHRPICDAIVSGPALKKKSCIAEDASISGKDRSCVHPSLRWSRARLRSE